MGWGESSLVVYKIFCFFFLFRAKTENEKTNGQVKQGRVTEPLFVLIHTFDSLYPEFANLTT